MSLPQDMDYFSLPASLSLEVREILDRVKPSTVSVHASRTVTFNKSIQKCVDFSLMNFCPALSLQLGAASRLQGITPAAIVHLLNYVRQTSQQEKRAKRKQSLQKEQSEEEEGSVRKASVTR